MCSQLKTCDKFKCQWFPIWREVKSNAAQNSRLTLWPLNTNGKVSLQVQPFSFTPPGKMGQPHGTCHDKTSKLLGHFLIIYYYWIGAYVVHLTRNLYRMNTIIFIWLKILFYKLLNKVWKSRELGFHWIGITAPVWIFMNSFCSSALNWLTCLTILNSPGLLAFTILYHRHSPS